MPRTTITSGHEGAWTSKSGRLRKLVGLMLHGESSPESAPIVWTPLPNELTDGRRVSRVPSLSRAPPLRLIGCFRPRRRARPIEVPGVSALVARDSADRSRTSGGTHARFQTDPCCTRAVHHRPRGLARPCAGHERQPAPDRALRRWDVGELLERDVPFARLRLLQRRPGWCGRWPDRQRDVLRCARVQWTCRCLRAPRRRRELRAGSAGPHADRCLCELSNRGRERAARHRRLLLGACAPLGIPGERLQRDHQLERGGLPSVGRGRFQQCERGSLVLDLGVLCRLHRSDLTAQLEPRRRCHRRSGRAGW